MPQFDFLTFSSQIFWFFASFCALITFLYVFFIPKLESIISSRMSNSQAMLDELNCNKLAIENMLSDLNFKTHHAYDLFASKVSDVLKSCSDFYDKEVREFNAYLFDDFLKFKSSFDQYLPSHEVNGIIEFLSGAMSKKFLS
jgi:hypothetical protein